MPEATRKYLAFDLGAESGRGILGGFDGQRLDLTELRRFPNGPVQVFDHLHWNPLQLFGEMQETLSLCAARHGRSLDAIGIDTWGVDFALLGRGDTLLGNPHHYRDPRTEGAMEAALERVPRERIFACTGIQFMKINTLYQLYAMRLAESPLLDVAETFLMMADLLNYYFTGVKACEFSNATTTQFYDPRAARWATELLDELELPGSILPQIVPPGTALGQLVPAVASRAGLDPVQVLAPATHDTGSAVASIPATIRDYAYISSGTWSLMGVELDSPLVNDAALEHNFTNEGGVADTFRFLKNIMGLWLVQECRRTWEREGRSYSYAELTELARQARPFAAVIDPDDDGFLAPGDMPARIRAYCERTGQAVPADEGELIRVVLESLALRYRQVLEGLEEILGRRLECIHVVGGGSQNQLLCELTASAAGRALIAGPAEATAIGNLMVLALGRGDVGSLAEAREVVRNSFELRTYEPDRATSWDAAFQRFLSLVRAA